MDCNRNKDLLAYYNAARNPLTHKGDYGRVFIIAGSEGMTGAAMLCAESALRTGAGLVFLFAPGKLLQTYEIGCREAVKIKVGDECDSYFRQKHVRQVADIVKFSGEHSAVVIGPGLGTQPDTKLVIYRIVEELSAVGVPVILDADGLNAYRGVASQIARYTWLSGNRGKIVLTPHAAELSRLTGMELSDINNNRSEAARKCAALTGAITVLKGSGTVISEILPTKEELCEINCSGNPGMATGGSGDVLSGILAGMIASDCAAEQDPDWEHHFFFLVCCGVYIHGLCGDLAAQRYGQRAVKAGDLIEMLKEVHRYDG